MQILKTSYTIKTETLKIYLQKLCCGLFQKYVTIYLVRDGLNGIQLIYILKYN